MRAEPLLALLLLTAAAQAAQDDPDAAPELELLEFIASFETEDGQWQDPLELDVTELQDAGHPADEVKR